LLKAPLLKIWFKEWKGEENALDFRIMKKEEMYSGKTSARELFAHAFRVCN